MPAKNTIKQYQSCAFYHVYNRGAGGRKIFLDDIDRRKFMSLLERHLVTPDNSKEDASPVYTVFEVDLIAYCLMGNHFHVLLFQRDSPDAITSLMRSVSTAYSMYFNNRHKDKGHLFQGVYKASHIDNESYLLHITRYIHLNPDNYLTYKWSSLQYYLSESSPLVKVERLPVFGQGEYLQFLQDYTDRRLLLKEIKEELAI